MSDSYKHKSGSQKRKLKGEKERKEGLNRQKITKFFKSFSEPEEPNSASSASASGCGEDAEALETNGSETCPGPVQEIKSENPESSNLTDIQEYDLKNFTDPALWPQKISDNIRQQIVQANPCSTLENMLNCIKTMPKDLNGKAFTEYLLYSKSSNNREKIPRDWLIYSSSQRTLHCLPCLLFSENFTDPTKNRSNLAKKRGFSPTDVLWKKLYTKLPLHENSLLHRNCYCMWKELQHSLLGRGIDSVLQKHILSEAEKWKALLKRLLDVTLFLASRGLPFQGDSTKIGDINNGNFLGILELLGHYDPVIQEHLSKIQKSQLDGEHMKGKAHYLSWMSQNEFICLCGDKLLKYILEEREAAIYYSIIADATPDVSHEEQNVFILRYVSQNKETRQFEIKERFIEFLNFNEKTGETIAAELLSALERHRIPLADCRGQGYDNGSNMSGKLKGVKSRILEKNSLALYSPCSTHSLNLIGVNAAKINPCVITFFGCVQRLYVLLSSSPAKWAILREEIGVSVMSQSETRWSSRIEAIQPIVNHLPGILKSLDRVMLETKLPEKIIVSETNSLKAYFSSFECIVMASFWFKVLSSIHERNLILQSRGISLEIEMKLMDDLIKELQNLRNTWHLIFTEVQLVAESMNIEPNFPEVGKRIKKRRTFHDESQSENIDTKTTAEDIFKREIMFTTLDFIINDLEKRLEAHKEIVFVFSPILNYVSLSPTEIKEKSKELVGKYPKDLSPHLEDELLHLKKIHNSTFQKEKEMPPLMLLNEIYSKNLQAIFVNVCVALRIFCTLPVTVSEAERAFSKLGNQLKTWQRASTGQERLNSLGRLAIEHKLALNIDFSDLINDFALRKARKIKLS